MVTNMQKEKSVPQFFFSIGAQLLITLPVEVSTSSGQIGHLDCIVAYAGKA